MNSQRVSSRATAAVITAVVFALLAATWLLAGAPSDRNGRAVRAATAEPATGQLDATPQPGSGPAGTGPVSVAVIDKFIASSPAAMCASVLTAEVAVASRGTSHWNTSDGNRPNDLQNGNQANQKGYEIWTPLQFTKFDVLADHRSTPTKEFVNIGGRVGSEEYHLGTPELNAGDHYLVVFQRTVTPAQLGGSGEGALFIFDAFPIDTEGNVLLPSPASGQAPQGGGRDTSPPQPNKVSLAQLKQQLQSCR